MSDQEMCEHPSDEIHKSIRHWFARVHRLQLNVASLSDSDTFEVADKQPMQTVVWVNFTILYQMSIKEFPDSSSQLA